MDNGSSERKTIEMKNTDVFKKILENEGMVVQTKEEYQKLQKQIEDLEKKLLTQSTHIPIYEYEWNSNASKAQLADQKRMQDDDINCSDADGFYSPIQSPSPWRDPIRDSYMINVGAFVNDTDSQNLNLPKDFALRLMARKIADHIEKHMDDLIAHNVVKIDHQSLIHLRGTEFRMKIKLEQFT